MAIIIEEKSLTRRVIAESLGLNQPQVSMMLRGQVKSYSVEQLADFLSILNGRSPQVQPSQTQAMVTTTRAITVPPVSKAQNTDEIELKTALVQKMAEEISRRGLTQRAVGELLGFSQPQVSLLLKGRINAYSITQLSGYLETLRDQNPTVRTGPPVQAQQPKVTPRKAVEDKLASVAAHPSPLGAPSAVAVNGSAVAGMMEEIAYLRQHLVLVGRGDRQVIQAEVELLRRENALLREKTKRFERMTELLQFA